MKISDDRLSAFLDGELPEEEARLIENAVIADPAVAERLNRLRNLDRLLKKTYSRIDSAPLPEGIAALLAEPVPGANGAPPHRFVPMPGMSASSRSTRFLPIAAAILLMAGLGFVMLLFSVGRAPFGGHADPLASVLAPSHPVFGVLETQPSGQAASLGAEESMQVSVLPVLTFRSKEGQFCREFIFSSEEAAQRALACREDERWKVRATAAVEPGGGLAAADRYAPASGPSQAEFDQAAEALRSGDPLSAEAERDAIEANWRP